MPRQNYNEVLSLKKAIRIFDVVLFFVCVVIFSVIIWGNFALPSGVVTYDDNSEPLAKVFTYSQKSTRLAVDKQTSAPRRENLKLFGIIPVKEVSVTEKSEQKVMVSGEVFGIKLYTDGVIVVGIQDVQTDEGKKSPSGSAGIEVGDIIVSINGENVYTSDRVQGILGSNNGES